MKKNEEVTPCPTWEAGIALWLRQRGREALAHDDRSRAQRIAVLVGQFDKLFLNAE